MWHFVQAILRFRWHLTVANLQIRVLDNILKTASSDTKQGQREIRVARILLYKVFYDQTESGILSFLLQLVKSFDIHKQPRRCGDYQ